MNIVWTIFLHARNLFKREAHKKMQSNWETRARCEQFSIPFVWSFLLHDNAPEDRPGKKRNSLTKSSSRWFIEIESFLMALFASLSSLTSHPVSSQFRNWKLHSLASTLTMCSHLNWWSILFSTGTFLFAAEMNVNYISLAPCDARSDCRAGENFFVIILRCSRNVNQFN